MNYEKAWKQLKDSVSGYATLLQTKGDEAYELSLAILSTMEMLEEPQRFLIVYGIDPSNGKVALVGHIADLNPTKSRLDAFKADLADRKLFWYIKGENPGIAYNEAMRRQAKLFKKLRWRTEIREWKGKDEQKAVGKELKL